MKPYLEASRKGMLSAYASKYGSVDKLFVDSLNSTFIFLETADTFSDKIKAANNSNSTIVADEQALQKKVVALTEEAKDCLVRFPCISIEHIIDVILVKAQCRASIYVQKE